MPAPVARAESVVVFGGGHLGAAVARHAASLGHRVLVASRTPRAHAGLWRAWEADAPAPVPMAGSRVVIALAPAAPRDAEKLWGELVPRLALAAWRQRATSVTVCGPAGEREPTIDAFARGLSALGAAPRTSILRFGPLVGVDDACVWPLVTALRERGVARLPRGLPPTMPLLLDDAARAVLRLADRGGEHVLRGPERLRTEDLGALVTGRFGGRWAWRWWGGRRDLARLRAWADLPDGWNDAELGPRTTLGAWIGRLPGLRRKR